MTLLLMQPSQADDGAWERLKARIELAPQDLKTFIERRTGCNHFDGEVGSDDPERERRVQAIRRDLRCDDIEAEAQRFRHKYRNRANLLQLLAQTEHFTPW